MTVEERLPDFLIIGTMKSGTTTLFRWLELHPSIAMPETKEPNFFTHNHEKGLDWYRSLFPRRRENVLSGEASVSYSAPDQSRAAARLIQEYLPEAKLICVLRDPLDRARSHYRHQVQRGKEQRSFDEATGDISSPYVQYSLYGSCLEPFLGGFEIGRQLMILRFEDLVQKPFAGWHSTLDFLELRAAVPPGTAYNVSGTKSQFTPLMRMAWRRKWVRRAANIAPPQLRRATRGLFLRRSSTFKHLVCSSRSMPFPSAAESFIWSDVKALEEAANDGAPLWTR
jgi:hypothetical protein